MNTNKHDWKKFSRRGLSLMLALVTLVALCIPTGVAVGDDADETAETAYTEVQETNGEETAAAETTEAEMEASASAVDSAEPETLVADESLVDTAEEETLTAKAAEPTALEPTAQMASSSSSSDASEEDAISTADLYDTSLTAGTYDVTVGGTTTISGSSNKSNWCSYGYQWKSSDESVATVSNSGSKGTVTGVSTGTATITHTYCSNTTGYHRNHSYATETFTVNVTSTSGESAAMYYLADPTQDWQDNDTSAWRPTGDISKTYKATVNTSGASWSDSNKNLYITESNYSKYVKAWPDGTTGYTWTLTRNDATTGTYFTSVLDECWDAYKSSVRDALEIDINKSDVSSVTITPAKISRNNGTDPDKHLDCTISFACSNVYVAKFMVENTNTKLYDQVDAKYYMTGSSIAETTAATIGSTTTIGGEEYVLTGWYNEAGELVDTWNYTPNDSELADGTVYFYAHYEPSKSTETVFVYVAGYEWVDGKKALYSDEMLNLLGIDPNTLDANGYFPVGSIEVAKSYFTNKGTATQTAGKALLNDESDWKALFAALGNLDTSVIDDGIFVNNQNNKVADYLEYAGKDFNHGWGSMYTALFRWHKSGVFYGTGLAHLGYSEKWQATDSQGTNSPVQYHLDLRFSTNHITFKYGNNNITDGSIYADGNDAYQNSKLIGSQVYITNSVTAAKDAYSTFDVPEGYTWDGKFYKDADFTTEYSDDEIFSINIKDNYDVYLKMDKNPGTLVINKTLDIQSNWMTDAEKASLNDITFTATCTSDRSLSFNFKLSDMTLNEDGTYTYSKTDLPGDSAWTVTESGAELTYHNLATETTYEQGAEYATVPKGDETAVSITNTYTDKMVDLTINKTVTGSNTHAGSFTFLAKNTRTGVTYTATITTSSTGSYTISNIPAGTYTVKELGNDNYDCKSQNPQTQDVTDTAAFVFTNEGDGDSYQYSSAVVNKFQSLMDDMRVVFTKVIPSATK